MIELIFKLMIIGIAALGVAWSSVYYIIAFKHRADPHFRGARSTISFIEAQPKTVLNLFAIYRCIEIAIYSLLIAASTLLVIQVGMHWLKK